MSRFSPSKLQFSKLWPYAVIIGLTLLFFYKLAFTGMILARGDMYAYFYPYWAVRNAALMAGHIPLWTPDIFMGVPLLANSQVGVFYPPNWLVASLNAPTAITVSLLLHVAWALAGAYRVARGTLGLDQIPALVAAAVFGLSGYMGAKVENINQFQALAWMPWLFLLLHHAMSGMRRTTLRYGLLLGVGLALQLLAGHPQTVFITALGLGMYAVTAAFVSAERPSGIGYAATFRFRFRAIFRTLLILACAGIIAVILASPQLIPTLELIRSSNRSGGLNPQQAMAFSLNPWIIGRGMLPSYDSLLFGEYMAYVGVIGLGLAVVGVFNGYAKRQGLKPPGYPTDKPTKGAEIQAKSDDLLSSGNQSVDFDGDKGDNDLAWTRQANRLPWIVLMVAGFGLALGLYNPLYWTLASLPGFSFFRVPARWLALFALGAAMLAGIGLQSLRIKRPTWWVFALIVVLIGGLAWASFLADVMAMDVIGPAEPTRRTLIGWGLAACVLLVGLRFVPSTSLTQTNLHRDTFFHRQLLNLKLFRINSPSPNSGRGLGGGVKENKPARLINSTSLLGVLAVLELFMAARVLAYNEVAPPDTFNAQRFTISQLRAYVAEQTPPGRVLSISQALFDPGDIEALTARYRSLGMSDLAIRIALVDTKLRDLLAANLPLAWGIPSIDGFDGGLLPSGDYSAFTSLMLPLGEDRSVDGRLREMMAQPECRGACIPEQRWLNLTNTRYLITDKVFDVWHEDVAYDTTFTLSLMPGEGTVIEPEPPFEADHIFVLCETSSECSSVVTFNYDDGANEILEQSSNAVVQEYKLTGFSAEAARTPINISIEASDSELHLIAVTLVDSRTGDFQQLTLGSWKRVLSSDIKLYENQDVLPRAFFVYHVDTESDTETALNIMRDPLFDPAIDAVVSPSSNIYVDIAVNPYIMNNYLELSVTDYTAERVEIQVNSVADGFLILTDAYYPGWVATVNGEVKPIHKADVMFRAVEVASGESTVVFEYKPAWWPGILIIGAVAWLAALIAGVIMYRKK